MSSAVLASAFDSLLWDSRSFAEAWISLASMFKSSLTDRMSRAGSRGQMPQDSKPLTMALALMPDLSARALTSRMLRRDTPTVSLILLYAVLTPL